MNVFFELKNQQLRIDNSKVQHDSQSIYKTQIID